MNTKTERLEQVLRNLGQNLSKLRAENNRRERVNVSIYYTWMNDKVGSSLQRDIQMHVDLNICEYNNEIIVKTERVIERQQALYNMLQERYNAMLWADIEKILNKAPLNA